MDESKGRGRGRGRPILGVGTPGGPPAEFGGLPAEFGGPPAEFGGPPAQFGGIPAEVSGRSSPRSALRVDAQEFVPRIQNFTSATQFQEGDQGSSSKEHFIDTLRQSLFNLSQNPGEFDDHMAYLSEFLVDNARDEKGLVSAINEIVSLSIENSNMAYLGAKMCSQLCQEGRLQVESGNFRQHLLKTLRAEFLMKDKYIGDVAKHQRLCGYGVFLGEVVVCVKTSQGGPIDLLIDALEDVILTLLSYRQQTEQPNLLMCAGRMIKMTGQMLEDHARRAKSHTKIDHIFQLLKTIIVENQSVNKSIKYFMLSIVELRASRWGTAEDTTATETIATAVENMGLLPNEPVYFNKDGKVITAEEAGFSAASEQDEEDFVHRDVQGDAFQNGFFPQEPEMDEEEEKAYEEFLQSQLHQQGNHMQGY